MARYNVGGKRLKVTRMLLLAMAAMAVEKSRREALNDAAYVEKSGILEGHSDMGYWTRFKRALSAMKRVGILTILFAPTTVLAPLSLVTKDVMPQLTEMTWDYILYSIEIAGPTFIKLSQWASTRSDLFPQEFCLRFAKLQDATRGHSWVDTDKTLKEAFGDDWSSQIELDESRRPIGSGCIAQVYHGKLLKPSGLKPVGEEVAVKIVHPHIKEKVEMDFYILNKVSKFLESLPRLNLEFLSMVDSVEQFRQIMIPQLDLRCEANNLERFITHFAENETVNFPVPLHEYTTNSILTESFIRGDRIMSYANPKAAKKDREELAHLGVKTVMEMLFLYDFVHGDLHPGNILVTRNKSGELALNLLDCGICVEMGESDHKNLVEILGAFIKRDGLLAGKLMVDTAKHARATDEDVKIFCDGIQRICSDDLDNNFLEKVGDYLADICDLACRHRVKLESKFINASLAVEIMEGLACKLHPEMEVQKVALPLVLKAEVMHGMRRSVGGASKWKWW